MTTMNLSPKNPIVFGALVLGAWYVLSRRHALAASVQPSRVGATVQQQAMDAGRNGQLLQALGSWFSNPLQPSVVTEAGRAAVRFGDPYYGGTDASAAPVGTAIAPDATTQANIAYGLNDTSVSAPTDLSQSPFFNPAL